MTKPDFLGTAIHWLGAHINFVVPLCLSIWMAWGDVKSRRIPNYLTSAPCWPVLAPRWVCTAGPDWPSPFLGMVTGFVLLIVFYVMGGMGTGDVKALAALGTWLGPAKTFELFLDMAIFGGVFSIALLWWRGQPWSTLRQGLVSLKNLFFNYILLRPHRSLAKQAASNPGPPTGGIPYAVALAAGMAVLLVRNI